MWRNPSRKLAKLIDQAARELSKLGQSPVAIASAANKYNDAHEDDYWCSVQLGPYRWEQSQFFGSGDRIGSAEQFSTQSLDPDDHGSATANANDLNAARGLLRRLDQAGWHKLASEATGLPCHGGILAVVIQFNQVWLHCSHPLGSAADQIYALVEGKLERVAWIDDRFDDVIGGAELIKCDQPDPKVVEQLSPVAQSHFSWAIDDEEASLALARLLIDLALKIDDLIHSDGSRDRPFAWLVGFTNWSDRRYKWDKSSRGVDHIFEEFAIGETYFDRNYFGTLSHCRHQSDAYDERLRVLEDGPYERLDDLLRTVDETQIRRLFETATGTDTFDQAELYLLVSNAVPYLRFRNRLYGIRSDGVRIVGDLNDLCDPLGPGTDEWIDKLGKIFATPNYRH